MASQGGESRTLNNPTLLAKAAGPTRYFYSTYGLRIRTTLPLTIPEIPADSGWDIDVSAGDSAFFEESLRHLTLNSDWAQAHRLPGGWLYARIERIVEFLVSQDGSQVFYSPLGEFSLASFEAYLLGILMKAVMIKKDIHSLHASAVIIDGRAVAFLGSNGVGKSSLAASFVSAGYSLLTDDLLRLDRDDRGIWAYPGPAFLKLLPDAHQGLDGFSGGIPMDPSADKYLIQVTADLQCQERVPLAAIYSLIGPENARETEHIRIDPMEPREALAEILYGIHTDRVVEADRVTKPFEIAKQITEAALIRRLTYPWELTSLPQVRNAVLADVRGA